MWQDRLAKALLAEAGFDPVFGQRPLKRAIRKRIENPLSRLIFDGSFGPKDKVPAHADKGGLNFKKPREALPPPLHE